MKKIITQIGNVFKRIQEIIRKKWLTDTFMTILLIAIIFTAYIGTNLWLKNTTFSDIDVTKSKIYSLSDSSVSKIKNINKKVIITLINYANNEYVTDFVKKYTKANKNITVEEIGDLSARTDLMKKYNLTDTDSLIIISSDGRESTLTSYDLSTYDYSTYEEVDLTEEAITNAILGVTIENKPKIYFLTGHNYYSISYFSSLIDSLKAEANETDTLDLLSAGKIPDDCACLVITTLREDITQLERDTILEYINNAGKILLLSDSNVLKTDLTNFNSVLSGYGMNFSDGILIEQDTDKMISSSPNFIISNVSGYNSISNNSSMDLNICLINPGKINFENEDILKTLSVTYEPIATVSSSAFLRTDYTLSSSSKTGSDEDAPNSIVAALVTKSVSSNKASQLLAYSNSIFATNTQLSIGVYYTYPISLYNNEDVLLNSISYLTERDDNITIRKGQDTVQYTVTEKQNKIISTIIFIMPAAIILSGIIIWQIRRRKR